MEVCMNAVLVLAVLLLTPTPHHARSATPAQAAALDTAQIEQLTGAKGKLDTREGVFKVSVPRTDLSVTVGGVSSRQPRGSPRGPRSSEPVPARW